MTDTPDPVSERRRKVVIAGHARDEATARSGLSDSSPEVRAAALGALERIGTLAGDELSGALRDPSALVRRRAALVAAGRDDLGDVLEALLVDPEDVVVEVAAFAWGERKQVPGSVIAALTGIVDGHEDSLCREAAVAALGSIGDPRGLQAVLRSCGDKATVRRRAVLALAAFDGPEVTEALRSLTGDRDLQVRQSAEELLSIELGEEIRPGAPEGADPEIRPL